MEAREGRFRLRRGHWIALERDSRPLVQSDRYGLCLGLVLSAEGLRTLEAAHPDVEVFTASIDERLDERGYILPGLGDAGDRIFGTRP